MPPTTHKSKYSNINKLYFATIKLTLRYRPRWHLDEIIKQVAQSVNQTLLTTNVGSSTINIAPNEHHTIGPRHTTLPNVNPNPTHTQTHTNSARTYRAQSPKDNTTYPVTMFEWTKQIIMDTDALSHSPALCNNILQSLNLNGLCKYDNLQKAY